MAASDAYVTLSHPQMHAHSLSSIPSPLLHSLSSPPFPFLLRGWEDDKDSNNDDDKLGMAVSERVGKWVSFFLYDLTN